MNEETPRPQVDQVKWQARLRGKNRLAQVYSSDDPLICRTTEEYAVLIVREHNSHDPLVEALANIAGAAAARGADTSLPAEARDSFAWIDRCALAAIEEAKP